MEDIKFSLKQVAQMTMLTERTLHNYMKRGLLHGCKTAAGWQFSCEQISQFMEEPFVTAAIQSKHLSIVEDFLHQRIPTSGKICLVHDIDSATEDICQRLMLLCPRFPSVRMAYYQAKNLARFTLCGEAHQVSAFLSELQAAKGV